MYMFKNETSGKHLIKREVPYMPKRKDLKHEGNEKYFTDIDRMVNEGLGGGVVHHKKKINGKIGHHQALEEESFNNPNERARK